jgi:iron-sulfur cluster assembly accessory protein
MKKDAIFVTDSAKKYIAARCNSGKYKMKVAINNKGCSGHSYEYSLVTDDQIGKFDETVAWSGGGVCIDSASLLALLGSTLDVQVNEMEEYLVWHNPHVQDTCGCGVSFSLR